MEIAALRDHMLPALAVIEQVATDELAAAENVTESYKKKMVAMQLKAANANATGKEIEALKKFAAVQVAGKDAAGKVSEALKKVAEDAVAEQAAQKDSADKVVEALEKKLAAAEKEIAALRAAKNKPNVTHNIIASQAARMTAMELAAQEAAEEAAVENNLLRLQLDVANKKIALDSAVKNGLDKPTIVWPAGNRYAEACNQLKRYETAAQLRRMQRRTRTLSAPPQMRT